MSLQANGLPKEATRDRNVYGVYLRRDPHVCDVAGHNSGIHLMRGGTEARPRDLDDGHLKVDAAEEGR